MNLAQIDALLETAKQGASLGGQGLLFFGLLVLGIVVIYQHKASENQHTRTVTAIEARILADQIHHTEVVAGYKTERDSYSRERTENFQILLRIASESSAAIREQTISSAANTVVLKTAIDAQVAATQSLRTTMHGLQNELQSKQTHRDLQS